MTKASKSKVHFVPWILFIIAMLALGAWAL